jgi:50S ribosomal protein L16 3-hydroxylase
LAVTPDPARLPADFVGRVQAMLQGITWDEATVRDFVGRYFSEPKAHVFYDAPEDELDEKAFAKAVAKQGVALDLKTVMLFDDDQLFINGDTLDATPAAHVALRQLANTRALPAGQYDKAVTDALYTCYEYGYLHLG